MPPTHTPNRIRYVLPFPHSQPGHRLGINSLALDTSTTTNNVAGPQGILYSAGRDGMVSAWDVNLQLKEKQVNEHVNGRVSGEIIDDDGQRTALVSDGKGDRARDWDVQGDKVCSYRISTHCQFTPTTFRAQVQAHTHWVNDIVLAHHSTSGRIYSFQY